MTWYNPLEAVCIIIYRHLCITVYVLVLRPQNPVFSNEKIIKFLLLMCDWIPVDVIFCKCKKSTWIYVISISVSYT